MRLDINANGSWRTVVYGLSKATAEDEQRLAEAKGSAQTLAAISATMQRKPITWRLVSEADLRVIERCSADGWVAAAPMEYA